MNNKFLKNDLKPGQNVEKIIFVSLMAENS